METLLLAGCSFGSNDRSDFKVLALSSLSQVGRDFDIEFLCRCKQLEVLKLSTCSYSMLEHIIQNMPDGVIHLEVDEISSLWDDTDWYQNQDNDDVIEYDLLHSLAILLLNTFFLD